MIGEAIKTNEVFVCETKDGEIYKICNIDYVRGIVKYTVIENSAGEGICNIEKPFINIKQMFWMEEAVFELVKACKYKKIDTLDTLIEVNKKLEQTLNEEKEDYEALQKEFDSLSEKYEELLTVKGEYQVGYQDLQKDNEYLRIQLDTVRTKLENVEHLYLKTIEVNKKLKKELDENTTWSEGQIRELAAKCDKYGGKSDILEKENEALREKYKFVVDRCKQLEPENKELKELLDKRSNDYMDLSLEYDKLENKLQNVEHSHLKITDGLRDRLMDMSKIADGLQEKCEKLEKEKEMYRRLAKPKPLIDITSTKEYLDLKKKYDDLEKDFKDLYGRYEKQLTRADHLTITMNSLYGIPGIAGLDMLKKEKEKLQKENEELKLEVKVLTCIVNCSLYIPERDEIKRLTEENIKLKGRKKELEVELESCNNDIKELEDAIALNEYIINQTDYSVQDVVDILNAWDVLNNRLVDIHSVIFADGNVKQNRGEIVIYNRIYSDKDPKEYQIVKKAMDIKACQK